MKRTYDGDSGPAVDVNKLAADAMRAKLRGDTATAEKLQAELQAALRSSVSAEDQARDRQEKDVVVVQTASRSRTEGVSDSRTKRGRVILHEGGQQVRHFADDDAHDLDSLVRQEKSRDRDDTYDHNFARNVMYSSKYKAPDVDRDEENAEMWEAARGRDADKKRDNRERQRAVQKASRTASAMERCWFCLSNSTCDRSLIVSIGVHAYLALPAYGRLMQGHCFIVPALHLKALKEADDDLMQEIRNFKKCLIRMFQAQGKEAIFMETVADPRKNQHTYIECIPLPRELARACPAYFKKGIMEADEPWSTNPQLIDTRQKGIQRSVPEDFPYFHVEFGLQGGFAHVIEDASLFPRQFGREIVAGMLELDMSLLRMPRGGGGGGSAAGNDVAHRAQVKEFIKSWQQFDWTVMLEGGDYNDPALQKQQPAEAT